MANRKFNIRLNSKIPPFNKTINVDSDKSLSIRSILIGSISQNISTARNVLESEDVKSAIATCRKLGVKIKKIKTGHYKIYGNGLGSLSAKKNIKINFGNSGTLARLIIGILTSTPNIQLKITGDHSLNKRSMKELISLMSRFGASFLPKNKFKLPLKFQSSKEPIGINYLAGESAQLKSAVILAGLNSYGITNVFEKTQSRDHTENLLSKNKQAIKIDNNEKKRVIKIFGKKNIDPIDIDISGDPSSAAFFTTLALLNPNSHLKIRNVGLNPTRIGFYKILKKQKAKIKFLNLKKINNEIRGDITAESSMLLPIKASKKYYVSATDEYPILFVIAALTNGVSIFKGIGDLANKESNRIKEMQKVLKQIGVKSTSSKNDLKIYGRGVIDASKKNIYIPNLGDHRICMSSFILALITGARLKINNFETVNTSSPSFLKTMKLLGAKFETKK